MRKLLGLILVGFGLALVPQVAFAESTNAGCVDVHGKRVGLLMDIAIKDLAAATMIDGRPFILYRPELERSVAMPTMLFVYAHECAHQALGHMLDGASLEDEKAADCWAINLLYRNALVSDADLRVIERDVARFGAGDDTHLAGPYRALALADCLQSGNKWVREDGRADQANDAPKKKSASRHASGLSKAAMKSRSAMGAIGPGQ